MKLMTSRTIIRVFLPVVGAFAVALAASVLVLENLTVVEALYLLACVVVSTAIVILAIHAVRALMSRENGEGR